MKTLKDFLPEEVKKAIKKTFDIDENLNLSAEKPKNTDFGDYAVNVSSLAKILKLPPPVIADKIAKNLTLKDFEITVVAGFINFKLKTNYLKKIVKEIFMQKENYGKPETITKEKILLEYVSANPTGPFHIGHGRWAAMGSALANLLKFYGHDVWQEFYINDAGSQIQKLGKSLEIRLRQELGEKVDFPTDETERKNYYAGEYLIPVAKKFLAENSFTDDITILSDFAKKEMETNQKALLKKFQVFFDQFYSELTLHQSKKVEECVEKLKKSGKIYEKDGAVWFKSSDYEDDADRVIKKADGSNTYLTADIAYHLDKLERGFTRLINIWGADHHGYIARVRASIEALGYNPNSLEVLLGQLVNLIIDGEQTRMGKRKNMITLDDLIDEVGVDATRFWMIMRNIDTTLDFDVELAKTSSDENPVFYVQYAHARACAILRNLTESKINPETGNTEFAVLTQKEIDNLAQNFDENILNEIFEQDEKSIQSAKKLILKLEEYPSLIKFAAENRAVYMLCRYLQDLASDFHYFYTVSRVKNENKTLMLARLSLIIATKNVIKNVLNIIANYSPEKI